MANKSYNLAHTKWMCKYHIVFTPKYRRKIRYRITAPHVPIGSNAGEPNNKEMQTAILKESLEWVRYCPQFNGLKVLPYEYRHNV